ncbi:ABC transporter ATP-binding protein [Haloglycomyces albus]|uniref:ABC transporter ATP-binding protein n=1 Tax=Haloglycomyces albus TaxID=526067 RepID=UPI00046CAE3B|nr:ABC transporter ATP-binding protein [Haloglycomyces albus]
MVVTARGLGFRHAGRRAPAVQELDFHIADGENVLLLGPSGSGKSTLLALLAGLADTRGGELSGELTIDGSDPAVRRNGSGMVFQDPLSQIIMARCGDDVAFGLENQATPESDIWPMVRRALAGVGFPYPLHHPTAALSGGEMQRLAIAGNLARRPGLMLFDEPSANLDAEGRSLVWQALDPILADPDMTCVMVEHRLAEVGDRFDRALVLDGEGRLLASGSAATVLAEHDDRLIEHGIWSPNVPVPSPRRGDPGRVCLSATKLAYRYKRSDHNAVEGIDLQHRSGEMVAITGSNGSGKSTLTRLLGGLEKPRTGAVRVSDSNVPLHRMKAPTLAGHVGTVFQNPENQFITSEVREELAFSPRMAGWAESRTERRVDELLERLGLSRLARANPFTLSGGEARRLSVAAALAAAPGVLLLDEPSYGQDRRTWAEMLDLVHQVRSEGTGIIAVTHDRDFVAALSDREIVLSDGRVAEERQW